MCRSDTDPNTKIGAMTTYDTLKKCLDMIFPEKSRLIKTGNSAFPLPREYYIKKSEMKSLYRKGMQKSILYNDIRKECRKIRVKYIRLGQEKRISERLLKMRGKWAELDNLLPFQNEIPKSVCANTQSLHFQRLSYDYIEKKMKRPLKDFDTWIQETDPDNTAPCES